MNFEECVTKISELMLLPDGWDEGDSKKLTNKACSTALKFCEIATPDAMAPLSDGGIMLEWGDGSAEKFYVSLDISPRGKFSLLFCAPNERPIDINKIDIDTAKEYVDKVRYGMVAA